MIVKGEKTMKRVLTLLVAVVMVLSSFACTSVFAEGDIKVTINGVEQSYDDDYILLTF